MNTGLADFATATQDDVYRLYVETAGVVGSARAVAALAQLCVDSGTRPAVADVVADRWSTIGTPVSVLPPSHRDSLFMAASPNSKLRMVSGLVDAGEVELATCLADRVEAPHRFVLNRAIELGVARSTFQRNRMLAALEALRGAVSAADWRFLCEGVRHDVSGSTLVPACIADAGLRLRIVDAYSVQISVNRDAKAYPEINEQIFLDEPQSQGLLPLIPLDHILRSIELLLDRREYFRALNLIKVLVDRYYIFNSEVYFRRYVAALVMRLVEDGVPIPTRVLAYLIGQMAESSGWREAGRIILKANIVPEAEISSHTYFLFRRACLMTAHETEMKNVTAKIAAALPSAGPQADKHAYFLNGRIPEALQRDVGWQQGRIDELVRDLGVVFHPGAPGGDREAPKSKRVAIFLSGQLRSFERVFASIKREVIDPLQADLFIVTWDTVGFALGAHDDVSRMVNRSIYSALPPELQSRKGFTQRFPKAMRILEGAKEDSFAVIRTTVGDVPCAILNERKFDSLAMQCFPAEIVDGVIPRVRLNQFKMFFLSRICAEMLDRAVASTGQSYDWVVRMRPDMDVQSFVQTDLTMRDPDANLVSVHGPHPVGINDQFAYGSQDAMRRYFSGFDFLLELGGFKNHTFQRDLYGEAFLFDCLSYWGVRISFAQTLRYNLSASRLTDGNFVRLLLDDCGQNDADDIASRLRRLVAEEEPD